MIHTKRKTQITKESNWRVDRGNEAIIKRAQYDGENGGLLD